MKRVLILLLLVLMAWMAAGALAGCATLELPRMTCVEAAMLAPTIRLDELERRCWSLDINKTNDEWTIRAKPYKWVGAAKNGYYAEGRSKDAAVADVLRQMEKP